ncbi:hypothetical protein QZH41_016103 [Actinostola sp. cb2023]|nr:hypothetical protein QZH41_016103 [Actinostola sp. cb2023]
MYHTDSDLERRFVSEPQLSHGNVKDNKNVNAVNASPKPADYKPYTLKDYRQIKNEQLDTLGSLGPDTESDDYKEKITKLNKQREYAEMLRIDHAARKKQWAKKPGVPLPTARHLQAEAKRQAAINYSKTVPKPKSTDVAKHHKEPNQVKAENNDKDVPLIEVLRMRHVQEKHHIEAIRKQLTAKTSHI